MRMIAKSLMAVAMLTSVTAAAAQEVLVTGQRRSQVDNNGVFANNIVATQRPIINLRRTADYVVQQVRLTGDTRDQTARMNDLNATLRNMIAGAGKAGVELAIGDYVIEPLTLNNYRGLSYTSDGRPDTSVTSFLVKVKLTPGMDIAGARAQIKRFVDGVDKVGRSTLFVFSEPTLSVVNPDQYRGQIADLIAADAAAMKVKFGPDYGVEVTGLDRPVEWARAGQTDVFLYLPSAYTVTRR